MVDFVDVLVATVASEDPTGFTTLPVELSLPIPDLATGAAASIGIENAVLAGTVSGGAFGLEISMTGELVVQDVVDALIVLGGFDEEGALNTVAEILSIEGEMPRTTPFAGVFEVGPQI